MLYFTIYGNKGCEGSALVICRRDGKWWIADGPQCFCY